ncbi:MAG: DedA family protein [Thermoplasmata archaeon]|nr:DedA family protein [Thermoplasmata archaeon]
MTFSLIGSIVGFITLVLATIGLPGLFALMAVESFGIPPIPSEVVLPLAGFLVVDGTFPLDWTIVAAISGSLVGAFIAYAVGRWWRSRLAGLGIGHLRIREADLDRMDEWFSRHGEVTVLVGRLIPGVLSYISYPAGTARMRPSRFGLYTFLGSTPWTLGFLYAGIVLGNHWQVISRYFLPIDIALVVVIVAAAAYLVLVATGDLAPGWPPRRGPRRSSAPAPPASDGATAGPPKL